MENRFRFRVWCVNKQQWEEGKVYIDNQGCIYDDFHRVKKETHIIQQCTGLRDKNGKLIYEGDIIVIPNLYPFYDYKYRDKRINLNETGGEIKGESVLNYIGIVEWGYSNWDYVYHCVNPQKQGISEGISNSLNEEGYKEGQKTHFEIIGNIYENKDLLKERE